MTDKEKLFEACNKLREAIELIDQTRNYKSTKSSLDVAEFGINQAIENIQTAISSIKS